MAINTNFKSNTIHVDPKVDIIEDQEVENQVTEGTEGSTEVIDETFGIPDLPGIEDTVPEHIAEDDYMCGDTTGGYINNATANDPGILDFLKSFPPTLQELIDSNAEVSKNLDLVELRYENVILDLQTLQEHLNDLLFTGQVTADEAVAIQAKLEAINVALSRAEVELENTRALMEASENEYYLEKMQGIDRNGDGWVGRPNTEGSYGILQTYDGQWVYIDPISGVVLDHPPYSNPDYSAKLAHGNVELKAEDFDINPEHPTADVTIQITDSTPCSQAQPDVPCEFFGVQYFWVKRDGTNFEPELSYKHNYNQDSEDGMVPTEPCYELAGFTTDADGAIVQETPDDISGWFQVEVAETVVTSWEREGGGYDHFMEFRDKMGVLICRVRITGKDFDHHVAGGRPLFDETQQDEFNQYIEDEDFTSAQQMLENTSSRLDASSVAFAFNADNVFSPAQKFDFSGIKSTGRTVLGDAQEILNFLDMGDVEIPQEPSADDYITSEYADGKENPEYQRAAREYWSFMENIGIFTDESYQMRVWDSKLTGDDASGQDWYRAFWEAPPTIVSGESTMYIDPTSEYAHARHLDEALIEGESNALEEANCTETVATSLTGVIAYGSGLRGHVVGTDYNDIIKVADVDELFQSDYYRDHYPYAEPTDRNSPYYTTVVEMRGGNNIYRGFGGDQHVESATFAKIDGKSGDNAYVVTQGSSNPSGGYDYENNQARQPVNPKSWLDIDMPGGDVAIDNPNEKDGTQSGEGAGDADELPEGESFWTQSTFDDFYNLNGGHIMFTHINDYDANDAMGGPGMLNGYNQIDESDFSQARDEAADLIWDEILKVEQPDNPEAFIQEWNNLYGVPQEMQDEMNSFFDTMFGMGDDMLAEFAEQEALNSFNSPDIQ